MPAGVSFGKLARKLRAQMRIAGIEREELYRTTPTRKQMTWHDLRATGVAWATMRGDDVAKIMQRPGHKDFEVMRRYMREAENLRDADFGEPFPPLPPELYGGNDGESNSGVDGAASASGSSGSRPVAEAASVVSIDDAIAGDEQRNRLNRPGNRPKMS